MGSAGAFFPVFLLLAIVAHFLAVLSYGELSALRPGRVDEPFYLKQALGSLAATVLPLCSKVMFIICASTGILATAGYVFNEVFVYWFPNLGFSFCLLVLLLTINLLGRKVAMTAQVVLVSVALSSLAFLVFAGFMELGGAPKVSETVDPISSDLTGVALVGLFVFVGHELAALAGSDRKKSRRSLTLPLLCAIGLLAAIFSAWGLVSLKYVSLQRLADTTIPHMITARAILGQNGRIVMGIVVIAGTMAAVNGLLFAVSRILRQMAREGFLPSLIAGESERPLVALLLLAGGIAAMMGLGMAGEPVLEIYTRASLLFWLLSYAAVHLAVLILRRNSWHKPWKLTPSLGVSVTGFLAMITGLAGLLWTDPESIQVVKFMLTMFGLLSIFTLLWLGFKRSQKSSVAMII